MRADVANIIPQQRAGEIAAKAGGTEGDWCPINPENFSSRKVPDIYVLGDASIAAEMPKSAFSANSQAKVVAADILAVLAKKEKFAPRYRNTCWSLLAPDDNVKIGANYTPKDGKLDPSGSFVSQTGRARRPAQAELPGEHCLVRQHHRRDVRQDRRPAAAAAEPKKAG